jgi:hypothetical protein
MHYPTPISSILEQKAGTSQINTLAEAPNHEMDFPQQSKGRGTLLLNHTYRSGRLDL